MGIEELFPFIPAVVYIIVARLKVQLPASNRAQQSIPDMAAFSGLVIVAGSLYLTGPYDAWDWLRLCFEGLMLGYAATGIHQSIKERKV